MMHALYVLQYAKRHALGQSSVKLKNQAPVLVVVELRLSEGISQSVIQSVSRKFHEYFF